MGLSRRMFTKEFKSASLSSGLGIGVMAQWRIPPVPDEILRAA
jgi:hypothetical protein